MAFKKKEEVKVEETKSDTLTSGVVVQNENVIKKPSIIEPEKK